VFGIGVELAIKSVSCYVITVFIIVSLLLCNFFYVVIDKLSTVGIVQLLLVVMTAYIMMT